MGRMTQNSLSYKVWAEVLARKIGTLRAAITGR
jgi:flagellar basal body rod protein FlgB